MTNTLSSPGSRALLVGPGTHRPYAAVSPGGSEPASIFPAVAATVSHIGKALVDECGLDPTRLHMHVDPSGPQMLRNLIAVVAERATDAFLLYYVGYGLTGGDGKLYLATAGTDDHREGIDDSVLAYSELQDALADCRAESVVVILDLCVPGGVAGAPRVLDWDVVGQADAHGIHLLVSTAVDETALAPFGRYTVFGDELVRLLREGDAVGPAEFDLEYIYAHLRRRIFEPDIRSIQVGRVAASL
ncbi:MULTISPECIES: caspase family protein, partial [unclassified Frankia]|uniref:caspase family protein n=1 Tax=unclassified Frankia TaxID=2632575 RepID=UPI002AD30EC0